MERCLTPRSSSLFRRRRCPSLKKIDGLRVVKADREDAAASEKPQSKTHPGTAGKGREEGPNLPVLSNLSTRSSTDFRHLS